MSILAELHEWYQWNEMKLGHRPEKSGAEKHFYTLWNEAERQLNKEFSEELRASIFAYMDNKCCTDFQAGFRLGVLLILEVQSAAATDPH